MNERWGDVKNGHAMISKLWYFSLSIYWVNGLLKMNWIFYQFLSLFYLLSINEHLRFKYFITVFSHKDIQIIFLFRVQFRVRQAFLSLEWSQKIYMATGYLRCMNNFKSLKVIWKLLFKHRKLPIDTSKWRFYPKP